MHRGYVKLWRRSIDSVVWDDVDLWRTWCCCLLLASHKKQNVLLNKSGTLVEVQAGQFITGRESFHRRMFPNPLKSSVCAKTSWRWLKNLEKMKKVSIRMSNKYSMVSIINWELYQNEESQNVQQNVRNVSGSCPDRVRIVSTYKNVKNDKNVKNNKIFLSQSVELQLATHLLDQIRINNPQIKEPNLQAWASHIDLMLRVDKRTADEIRSVIEWCQRDDFWKCNILSTKKLRDKYDQLFIKMRNGGQRRNRIQDANIQACQEFINDERIR